MSNLLKQLIKKTGIVDIFRRSTVPLMKFPSFSPQIHRMISSNPDYFRFATYGLAIQKVISENIPGSFAEAGVYQGNMSRFINLLDEKRKFFLFDTFEGFPEKDLKKKDERFKDTSVEAVLSKIKNHKNVVVRKGYIPETFAGLDEEKFAFVLLDMDIYNPTLASLKFFYPRVNSGGFIIVHDYNSPESDHACKRAVDEFFIDKHEKPVEIADNWGSVIVRKI